MQKKTLQKTMVIIFWIIFDALPNFPFKISEAKSDYWL